MARPPRKTPGLTRLETESQEIRERKQERLLGVYQVGVETARNYSIGDVYLNAWGEVDRLGYTDIDERVAFIEGYLSAMPRRLRLEDGKIVDIAW